MYIYIIEYVYIYILFVCGMNMVLISDYGTITYTIETYTIAKQTSSPLPTPQIICLVMV